MGVWDPLTYGPLDLGILQSHKKIKVSFWSLEFFKKQGQSQNPNDKQISKLSLIFILFYFILTSEDPSGVKILIMMSISDFDC